jgi:hypothetical protein
VAKWQRIALLTLGVIVLPLIFFQNRAEPAHCFADVCEPAPGSIGITRSGVMIVISTGQVVDSLKAPLRIPLRDAYVGIYPRNGVPYALAYLIGLALPLLLLWRLLRLLFSRQGLTKPADAPS